MPPPNRPSQHNCQTAQERADAGQYCRESILASGLRNIATPSSEQKISFTKLWSNYPSSKPYVDKDGNPPKGYSNQCAIKISLTLQLSGVDMSSFTGATVVVERRKLAIRAEELAKWLRKKRIEGISTATKIPNGDDWQSSIKNKKGILFFANYWLRDGEKTPSGDHIDLWNGSRLTASGLEGILVTAARFGLGINSGPGFSDLGKSTEILFWEAQ